MSVIFLNFFFEACQRCFKLENIKLGLRQCFYPSVVGVNMLGREEARPKVALPPPHLSWGHCAVPAVTFRAQLHHLAGECIKSWTEKK